VLSTGYESTDGENVSALHYNTLFHLKSTRMSPVIYKSRAACNGSATNLGSSYCFTGAPGSGELNYGAAVTGNMYEAQKVNRDD